MSQEMIADQNQQVGSAQPEITTSAAPAPVHEEKMVPQHTIDSVMKRVKQEAYEKGLNEGKSYVSAAQPVQSNVSPAQPVGDIQNLVTQTVQQQFSQLQQHYQQQQQQEFGQKIANDFKSKLDSVKANYEDFDSVVNTFPFVSFPHAVMAVNNMPDTGDLSYEMAKNPTKMGQIESLARLDAENRQRGIPSNLAERELQRLSDSIKLTKQATTTKQPNAPLSHVQPSPTNTDSGFRTVSDFRKLMR